MQEQIVGFQLSLQQRRCWPLRDLTQTFCAQAVVRVEGDLKPKLLREALGRVVARHEILRTTYRSLPGIALPVQVIAEAGAFHWETAQLRGERAAEPGAAVEALCRVERATVFDWERGPLLRALLVTHGGARTLILTLPALCADARTLRNLVAELARAYDGPAAAASEDEEEEVVQYLQFSEWQNQLLEEEETREGLEHWRRAELSPAQAPVLGFERQPGGGAEAARFETHAHALSAELGELVAATAARCETTTDLFLQACWQTLLWRMTTLPDVQVCKHFDGRKYEELHDALGLLAKFLPLSCRFENGLGFREVLRRAQAAEREASGWFECFGAEPSAAPEEAPAAGICYEFEGRAEQWRGGGVVFKLVSHYACFEPFKLKLTCRGGDDGLRLEFAYDAERFGRASVESLADSFVTLLEDAARDPEKSVGRLSALGRAERERLLVRFNDTRAEVPRDLCAHQLFEAQAAHAPRAVAVVAGEQKLTFAELNARANRLAHRLRAMGVGPDVLVALCLGRSIEMVVALLGVLKAGGAYVPLDATYPRERLAFMLSDSRAAVLLTERALAGVLPPTEARTLYLDEEAAGAGEEGAEVEENPRPTAGPENLAYVIYTSGSTGRPKGVMVEHRGLVNYLTWSTKAYLSGEPEAGAPVHSPVGFDLTVTSLFCPLLAGLSVHLVHESEGVEGLGAALGRARFGLVKLTPSHLELLARTLGSEGAAGRAAALVVGGEALPAGALDFWRLRAPQTRIVNEYGPTETVVGCCVHEVAEGDELEGSVPIGRPIANTSMYVLDAGGQPVPAGAAGELYVGGAGVARGYLGRPALTAERFVPDPFSTEPGARLYRTGDLGRHGPAGELEFLGRNDEQVKIRGFRVEPGEIEAVIKAHEGVADAAVVAREDGTGGLELAAYVVAAEGEAPEAARLREYLSERLPSYMIPATFTPLKSLPLTAHGKLDRKALPAPDEARPLGGAAYVAPTYGLEFQLAQIWEDVLGVRPVGVRDNFFDLKGHSILAMRVMAQVQRLFGTELPISLLFEAPTVESLAVALRREVGLFSKTPLVRLGADGAGRPFFCVHAVGGTVMSYAALARHLKAGRPFYAFQAPDQETPPATVEEVAASYVEAMRAMQPAGPYLLGGWSFGGVAAYEMARQLEEAGERVALLALFDRPAPVFGPAPDEAADDRLDDPQVFVKVARELAEGYARVLPIDFGHFRKLDAEGKMAYVLAQAKGAGLLPEEFELPQMQRLLRGYRSRVRAVNSYKPRGYRGRMTLFRAGEIDPADINPALLELIRRDETMGWGQFVAEPPEIVWVPGTHGTMVQEPHVQVLADKLRACIAQAEAE